MPTRRHRPTARFAARPHRTLGGQRCACGKIRSRDLEDARWHYREWSRINGSFSEVRFYECDWNSWHWTRSLVAYRPLISVPEVVARELVIPAPPRVQGVKRRTRGSAASKRR